MKQFNNSDIESLQDLPASESIEQNKLIEDHANQAPNIQTLKFQKVHKNYLSVVLIALFIPLPVFIGINVSLILFVEPFKWWLSLFFWIFYVGIVFWNIAYTKSLEFAIRQQDISLRSGVLFKRTIIQPYTRLQHIEIKRGPLERHKGLSSLALFSAGGALHALEVKGLLDEDAEKIKQFILQHKDLNNG